jgi:preprotein translocase subunit YajC
LGTGVAARIGHFIETGAIAGSTGRLECGGVDMVIGQAWAQGTGAGGGFDMLGMLPIILMFVVLYFLMIRPQMKRAKEHKSMIEALQKGDEVVTAGGVVGRVAKIDESYISLQVAENVEIMVQRPSVQLVLPKGTLKAL